MALTHVNYEEEWQRAGLFGTPSRFQITSLTFGFKLLDCRTEELMWEAKIHYLGVPKPRLLAEQAVHELGADGFFFDANPP